MKRMFDRAVWLCIGTAVGIATMATVVLWPMLVVMIVVFGLLMIWAQEQDARAAEELRGADLVVTDYRDKLIALEEQQVQERIRACN